MSAKPVRKDLVRTIFSRMLISYTAVMLVILSVTGIAVSVVMKKEIRAQRIAYLDKEAASLITLATSSSISAETEMEERARFIAAYGDHLVQIIRPEGNSISYYLDEKWEPVGSINYSRDEITAIFNAAGESALAQLGMFKDAVGFPLFAASRSYMDANTGRVLVLIMDDASDFVPVKKRIVAIAVGAILFGFFLSTVLVFLFTRALTKPFALVNETVQRYAKGDYNARIPVSGIREAGQLALSFNAMADQLKDLESTRQSFVANVSHELRSPLTSMKGFLEAMEDGTIGPEEHEKYLSIVLSETRRMTTMVNDLLDLARIESGQTVLHLEIFDINELIRRTLITFEARVFEKNIEVEVRFSQEQLMVEADSNQIAQVLRNLVDNALKYSPDNRKLRISTYILRKEAYISVQDFGYGIPEEDVPYVFDRFYKVEKAHTLTKQSGTGLGLSIVKKIIDQHGQTITLKSARGKGSTFTFTLKAVQPQQGGGYSR